MMRRIFSAIPESPGSAVEAAPGELDHIFKVLRARPGDIFEALDGNGGFGTVRVEPGRRLVLVERGREEDTPAKLILCCALPRRQKFDLLLKQAAELGVREIHPLACERSVADGDHPERWQSLLREACKQSGNRFVPEIFPLVPLRDALAELNRRGVAAYYGEIETVLALPPAGATGAAAWLVGPEGGFTDAENAVLRDAGARPLNLGPCVLRLETAAVCGLAVVRQLMRAALPAVMLLLAATGCGERSIASHPLTVRGRNFRDSGDGEAALDCFRRVIAKYPDSPEAYLQAATLCDEHLDKPELAHYFYNEYLRLAPPDAPDRQLIGKYRDSARTRLLKELADDGENARLRLQVAKLRAAVMAQQRQLAALNQAAAATAATAASRNEPRRYLVKAGDYPEKIARAHRIGVNELLRANNLNAKSRLRIGQELIIPAAGAAGQ